ncbi:DUF3558 domain-containing protein [Actinokineospora sp.]|uniref:DUF3558 domain-containing protein n=1 Tax=Actinokineospora sp. TaxID=1872133 RepID=UPI003D6BFDA7
MRAIPIVLLLSTLTLASGCSTETPGTPQTSAGTPAETSTTITKPTKSSAAGDAPKVTKPLDASAFLTQPCALLTAEQLAALNVTKPGKPATSGGIAETVGPYCGWSDNREDPHRGYSAGIIIGNKNGLSDMYRSKKQFAYFEPTTVDGYPGIFYDAADQRDRGSCNMAVAISDTVLIRVSERASDSVGRASCDGATKLAESVLANLKKGA